VSFNKVLVNEIADGECYIGFENVDRDSGECVGTIDRESISSAIQFSPGQILFPKLRPYLNKTHFATFGGLCSTEFHVLTPDGVSGEYLTALLRSHSIVGITSLLMTGNTLPRLHVSDIEQLPIPVPPKPIQEKVVVMWHGALKQRAVCLAQAQQLLQSLDDVLLDELGISRKPEPPNTLESRIFKSKFSAVTGHRWDPLFNQADVFAFIRDAKCDLKRMGSQVEYFITGFPAGRSDQVDEEDGGVIQIRPTNVNDDRELIFLRNVYIAAEELKTRRADVLKRREVLFNNTNSQEQVGKTVWFDLEGDYFSSNHITRIGTKSAELNPQYLAALLNLYQRRKVFFKLCTNWNNQSGVGSDILARMPIPMPKPAR
jgi:type I restriction enzyme S subunit